jgi:ubiquinone/menaquinone biosynthesis C-methylase UbiE
MTPLLERAGIVAGQSVLDVGFRDLDELRAIAALVGPRGYVLGTDVNPQTVEAARRELEGYPISNIAVKEGSVLRIPADDLGFDLVLCKGILHEVRQLGKALGEMRRVCREGGFVSILDFQRFAPFRFRLYQVSMRLRGKACIDVHPGFSRLQLSRLLSQHLLEEVSYQRLPEKWHTGPFEADAFLLKARRVG